MIVPLEPGGAHLTFRVTLSDVPLRFRLDWLTRWGYYNVEIRRGETVLAYSRALHPQIDLLEGLGLEIGQLYLEGEPATPSNLGETNRLRYDP